MKCKIWCFLLAGLLPLTANAAEKSTSVQFHLLEDLGYVAKPRNSIDNVKEALDFILADKIVRENILKAMEKGYTEWKATAEKNESEKGTWVVRVVSNSALPPYNCYFYFDSIGNDKRDIPDNGCQYE